MKAYKDFIISPIGERYNNSKKVGDKDLILNTEIFNHQYVNRLAKVIATPLLFQSPIKVGDEVIVHHNVFRRWHDVKGREKNSRSYWQENKYIVSSDQIYLYKKQEWISTPGYSFVKPIKSTNPYHYKLDLNIEKPLVGVIKYSDKTFNKEQLVGFTPGSEFEFVVNGERLYRVMNKFITIKYEYQGNEEEYNPSWAESS
jgi:acetyltransferase-like isoleucine patch superfamily enzyme